MSPQVDPVAFATQDEIVGLVETCEQSFLRIAELLHKAKREKHWLLLYYNSWAAYIEDFRFPVPHSLDWANKLIGVWENRKQLTGLSLTASIRLLPAARQGKLTPELVEAAKELRDIDLRRELGHKIPEYEECSIICPNCGNQVPGARWTAKKLHDTTFMVVVPKSLPRTEGTA